ncbi:MAG: tryptophanase [Clostridia bacterium]
MTNVKMFSGEKIPLEMHKARIVQKLNLAPIDKRLQFMQEAGNNTFLLKNRDVFLDMLTDSGVNAMSMEQEAAMFIADDSYAGSETFYRLEETLQYVFGKKYFLPTHQGRACEHIISKTHVKKGDIVPMNYHFTTVKAHIVECGGDVLEIPIAEALKIDSTCSFKGNMDIAKLQKAINDFGRKHIPFVRMEVGTNLIGGQPLSLENLKEVYAICQKHEIPLVMDASLLADNLHFIHTREKSCENMSILEICRTMAKNSDIIYFSGRKLGSARGGGMCTDNEEAYLKMRSLLPLFEGFLTYGGMSVREMEAMSVGIRETMDEDVISQGPQFIEFMTSELLKRGVPVVTPAGGLGCHINALAFLEHLPQTAYLAGALASAIYIISGIRGMERGTLSEQRDEHGIEPLANMELVRLALPRRVFTMSQVLYAVDRIAWLYDNRKIIGGLKWIEEPEILRFFFGRLEATSNWQEELVEKFHLDFGDSL